MYNSAFQFDSIFLYHNDQVTRLPPKRNKQTHVPPCMTSIIEHQTEKGTLLLTLNNIKVTNTKPESCKSVSTRYDEPRPILILLPGNRSWIQNPKRSH